MTAAVKRLLRSVRKGSKREKEREKGEVPKKRGRWWVKGKGKLDCEERRPTATKKKKE